MIMLRFSAALSLLVAVVSGCSEKTQQETREAGAAIAEDTKENVKKVGEVLEAAGDKAKEEFSSDDPAPAEGDADADGVPNDEDVNP